MPARKARMSSILFCVSIGGFLKVERGILDISGRVTLPDISKTDFYVFYAFMTCSSFSMAFSKRRSQSSMKIWCCLAVPS